jgi:hypothetical protein
MRFPLLVGELVNVTGKGCPLQVGIAKAMASKG